MKKIYLLFVMLLSLALIGNYALGQVTSKDAEYGRMKAQGLIPAPPQAHPVEPISTIQPTDPGTRILALKVPLDGTFTQVSFQADYTGGSGFYSDDGSTLSIDLPFTFCFYGTNESAFYINNNGNVSFGGPYSTFSSSGFPIGGFPMLAPFWADVDTRGGNLGSVWMKITPTAVIVIWDYVGYYQMHGDLRNTFELIFTDGFDPLIGVGNNVAFSYTTMQWTTGDASGGAGGFGGTPATVGVNKGDGIKYALVGRFDHAGADYNGAGGLSGISFLDGKYYTFDACQENVVIPTTPISDWALYIGIFLILSFAVIRFRRIV